MLFAKSEPVKDKTWEWSLPCGQDRLNSAKSSGDDATG